MQSIWIRIRMILIWFSSNNNDNNIDNNKNVWINNSMKLVNAFNSYNISKPSKLHRYQVQELLYCHFYQTGCYCYLTHDNKQSQDDNSNDI